MPNDVSVIEQNSRFFAPAEAASVSFENAAEKYLATLGSKASVITVRAKLNRIAKYFHYADYQHCDWHLMRYANAVSFIDSIKSGDDALNVVTINAYLCAIKGVAQMAWNLGQISDHDLMRIKSIKQVRGYRKPAGRTLSFTESDHLLAECSEDSPQQLRDKAILYLLLGCGLRRAEVAGIEMRHVFVNESRIRLIGKGNKERDVFMPGEVSAVVEKWIVVRRNVIANWNAKHPKRIGNAGDGSGGFLFGKWTQNYGYLIINKPLNPWSIADVVNRYKDKASEIAQGLKNVTTHDLRRTFATRLLDQGVDISIVKNLMGHSNIATTTLYDRRDENAMRQVISSTAIVRRKEAY